MAGVEANGETQNSLEVDASNNIGEKEPITKGQEGDGSIQQDSEANGDGNQLSQDLSLSSESPKENVLLEDLLISSDTTTSLNSLTNNKEQDTELLSSRTPRDNENQVQQDSANIKTQGISSFLIQTPPEERNLSPDSTGNNVSEDQQDTPSVTTSSSESTQQQRNLSQDSTASNGSGEHQTTSESSGSSESTQEQRILPEESATTNGPVEQPNSRVVSNETTEVSENQSQDSANSSSSGQQDSQVSNETIQEGIDEEEEQNGNGAINNDMIEFAERNLSSDSTPEDNNIPAPENEFNNGIEVGPLNLSSDSSNDLPLELRTQDNPGRLVRRSNLDRITYELKLRLRAQEDVSEEIALNVSCEEQQNGSFSQGSNLNVSMDDQHNQSSTVQDESSDEPLDLSSGSGSSGSQTEQQDQIPVENGSISSVQDAQEPLNPMPNMDIDNVAGGEGVPPQNVVMDVQPEGEEANDVMQVGEHVTGDNGEPQDESVENKVLVEVAQIEPVPSTSNDTDEHASQGTKRKRKSSFNKDVRQRIKNISVVLGQVRELLRDLTRKHLYARRSLSEYSSIMMYDMAIQINSEVVEQSRHQCMPLSVLITEAQATSVDNVKINESTVVTVGRDRKPIRRNVFSFVRVSDEKIPRDVIYYGQDFHIQVWTEQGEKVYLACDFPTGESHGRVRIILSKEKNEYSKFRVNYPYPHLMKIFRYTPVPTYAPICLFNNQMGQYLCIDVDETYTTSYTTDFAVYGRVHVQGIREHRPGLWSIKTKPSRRIRRGLRRALANAGDSRP